MNKKLFLGMFAAAVMLLATSCSNDELDVVQSGNEAQVSFSLGLEGGIATRAISDGKSADVLMYAVFDKEGNRINTIQKVSRTGVTFPTTENITLAKGQTYKVAFWAQDEDCKAYTVSDNMQVTVNYANDENKVNNDETRDAFFKTVEFTVTGSTSIDVELKRPFAQINVGVTKEDWNAAEASGITIAQSSVVIKNAATSLNLLDGTVSGKTEVSYALANIPSNPAILKVDTDGNGVKEEYKWLSMSYILPFETTTGYEKTTLENVAFVFASAGEPIEFNQGLNSVPVQRNWRTNILGKLLTGDIKFNIVIDEEFDGEYNNGKAFGVKANNQYYATIIEAINAGATEIELASGSWVMPTGFGSNINLQNKTLTFKGTKETVIDVSNIDERDQFVTGATLMFEGVTLNFGTTNYMGFANCTSLTYKDCTINGLQFVYGNDGTYTFENCELNSNEAEHCLWTWSGDKSISFTNCNFTYADRAVNCYGENGTTNISFTNCTFAKVADKPTTSAIETNSSSLTALYLTINNCTVNEGDLWWISTWDSKGGANTFATVDGKIATSAAMLAAIKDGATEVELLSGKYDMTKLTAIAGKTLTFIGDGPNTIFDYSSQKYSEYVNGGSGNFTFKNMTINRSTETFAGMAHTASTSYENCTITGTYYVYETTAKFTDCKFNVTGNFYNCWTWGTPNATFDGCTFNSDGKAMLLYGQANTKLTINNCTFNDHEGLTDLKKAAIEIGNDYDSSYELIVNNTVVNGFAINDKGINTGTTLWANKNSMRTDKLSVTVDGKKVY